MAVAFVADPAFKSSNGGAGDRAVAVDAHEQLFEFLLRWVSDSSSRYSRWAVRTVTYFSSALRYSTSFTGTSSTLPRSDTLRNWRLFVVDVFTAGGRTTRRLSPARRPAVPA